MLDDDAPRKQITEFPRPLDRLSVEELRRYILELQEEIRRSEADIVRKQAAGDAAAAFFKR